MQSIRNILHKQTSYPYTTTRTSAKANSSRKLIPVLWRKLLQAHGTAMGTKMEVAFSNFISPLVGNPRHSWILESTPWILDSNYWIPDLFQWNLDSGFLHLYSGFQGPGFRIPNAKISRIPESRFLYMGRFIHEQGRDRNP